MGGASNGIDIIGNVSNSPDYNAPNAPSGEVAKKAFDEAQAGSADQYTAEMMKQAHKADSAMTPMGVLKSQEAGMGMKNDAQLSAIQGKAKNYFNSSMNAIGMQAKMSGLGKDQELRMRAFDHVNRMNNVTQQLYQRRLAEETNRQASRNAVMGSIMGGIGTIGGAIIAGPAGAAAGGAIGGAMSSPSQSVPMGGGPSQTMSGGY